MVMSVYDFMFAVTSMHILSDSAIRQYRSYTHTKITLLVSAYNSKVTFYMSLPTSSIASGGGGGAGGRVPPDSKKFAKKREKIRKSQEGKKKGKNWEGSFTLPLLTEKAGYVTAANKRSYRVDRSIRQITK